MCSTWLRVILFVCVCVCVGVINTGASGDANLFARETLSDCLLYLKHTLNLCPLHVTPRVCNVSFGWVCFWEVNLNCFPCVANLASQCPQEICHPALTHLHSPTAFTSTSHAQAKAGTTNQNENHQPTPRAAKMTNGDGYHGERKTYPPVPPRRQNTRYCCLWFFLSPLSALVSFFFILLVRVCVCFSTFSLVGEMPAQPNTSTTSDP